MDEPKIISQTDKYLYPDFLFSRPINQLIRPQIGLFAGRQESIRGLSEMYAATQAIGADVNLVVPAGLEEFGSALPYPHFFYPPEHKRSNTAEIVELMTRQNLLVFGPDLHLSSSNQLLIEKIISSGSAPVVFTNEMIRIFKTSPSILPIGHQAIFFIDTEHLVKLAGYLGQAVQLRPGRGIYNKTMIISQLAEKMPAYYVCYDARQLLIYDPNSTDQFHLCEFNDDLYRLGPTLLGLSVGLIANPHNQLTNTAKQTLLACYILQQTLRLTSAKNSQISIQHLRQSAREILDKW